MPYAKLGTLYEPGLQDLAVELLKYEVRMATWKRTSEERRAEAFAFLKGSGLELVLETFGLPIEPQNFRSAFTQCLSQKSPWLFPTTLAISS